MGLKKWDLIIVGAGIVGCSAAYYAAKMGMKTLIVERDDIAAAQSGRALGHVRRQGRDIQGLPLMMAAMDIWRGAERELGRSIGWQESGNLRCALDLQTIERFERWLSLAAGFNLDSRIVTRREIDRLVPGIQHKFSFGLYGPDEGVVDPLKATRAFFGAAIELGAEYVIGSKVDEIVTGGGSTLGVRIDSQFLAGSTVICAAGAGSSNLMRDHGLLFPQDWVRATMMQTEPVELAIQPGIVTDRIGIRQDIDRSLLVFHKTLYYDVRCDSMRYARWFMKHILDSEQDLRINLFSKVLNRPGFTGDSIS